MFFHALHHENGTEWCYLMLSNFQFASDLLVFRLDSILFVLLRDSSD